MSRLLEVPAPVSQLVCRVRDTLSEFFAWIELVDQVRLERQMLAKMTDRDLSDMGIDRATAHHESARDAFDLPQWRLRRVRRRA